MKKAAHGLSKCDSCDFETYHRTNLKNHIDKTFDVILFLFLKVFLTTLSSFS